MPRENRLELFKRLNMEQSEFQEYLLAHREMVVHITNANNLLANLQPLAVIHRNKNICGVNLDGYQKAFEALFAMAKDLQAMEFATRQTLAGWIERVTDEAERNR